MPRTATTRKDRAPFVELTRAAWGGLRTDRSPTIPTDRLPDLAGSGEPLSGAEVLEVYAPLAELIDLHMQAARSLRAATSTFLGESGAPAPFVLGIAGSVAAGKSTTARVLRELLAALPSRPVVDLVTTDGFLFPNAELQRRGLLRRKGFPESYDQRRLLRFISQVKAGGERVTAPVYSHLLYDIVPDQETVICRPDVVILEGLNVLAPARPHADGRLGLAVSDFFDFGLYLDAALPDLRRWYVERFLTLRRGAFADPVSYFHRYADLDDSQAVATASQLWADINEPNLIENIAPTRGRATVVLVKAADHAVRRILVRRS